MATERALQMCSPLRYRYKFVDRTPGAAIIRGMPQVMGVDYGTRRLGVAVSDPDGVYGLPLEVLEVPPRARAAAVAGLADERDIKLIVIGRPVRSAGEDSALWPEIHKFGQSLRNRGFRVVYEDEAFSSSAAEGELRSATIKRGRKKAPVDALAARLILEQYLKRTAERG